MTEFEKRLKIIGLDEATQDKIEQVIAEAGKEFPCLSCPSRDDCGSFKWFLKWFGIPT
jgi:hypothetical protein